jgi:hypothetical protein
MSANPRAEVYSAARNARLVQTAAAALALAQAARAGGQTSLALSMAEESLFATLSLLHRRPAVSDCPIEAHLNVARYLADRVGDLRHAHPALEARMQSLAYNLAEEAADEFYGCHNDGTHLQAVLGHLIGLEQTVPVRDEGCRVLVAQAIVALAIDVEPILTRLEA